MTFARRRRRIVNSGAGKKLIVFLALLFMLSLIFVSVSNAQKLVTIDYGKQEFESRCASCHGKDGKGYGWLADFLIDGPPDLTLLSKNNGGVLPLTRIYQSIWDGTVPIHGRTDMPAWGPTYQYEAFKVYGNDPYFADIFAEGRILLLIEYINRFQAK